MSLPNLYSLNDLLPGIAHKIDFSRAIRGLRGMPRRVLLVGHKLTAGTLLPATITKANTEAEALALCGEGSMLMAMWRGAKANCDSSMPIYVVHLAPNGTGTAASTTIVVTNSGGTIQAVGEVPLYVEGLRVSVGVTTADTVATVVTKLIAAINAVASLPVTAAATATPSEIKLTLKWAGLTGNFVDVRSYYYDSDVLPSGLTLTIPAMSGGTTSPDQATLVAAMKGYRATEIASAFTDATGMNLVEVELNKRWDHNNMTDGQLCVAMRGSFAEVDAWLAGRNCEQVHLYATKKDATSPWVTAAMAAAAIEQQAVIDPAVPHTGIVLKGYLGPRLADGWEIDEMKALYPLGGSVLGILEDRTAELLRTVTNYVTNSQNVPDKSRRELCWIKTMSYYRWFTITEYALKYRGFKLGLYATDPLPGQKIMTPELVEEIHVGNYKVLMNAGLVQNMPYYKTHLVVELDGDDGKVKVQDEPVLVTQHYQTEVTSYPIAGQV